MYAEQYGTQPAGWRRESGVARGQSTRIRYAAADSLSSDTDSRFNGDIAKGKFGRFTAVDLSDHFQHKFLGGQVFAAVASANKVDGFRIAQFLFPFDANEGTYAARSYLEFFDVYKENNIYEVMAFDERDDRVETLKRIGASKMAVLKAEQAAAKQRKVKERCEEMGLGGKREDVKSDPKIVEDIEAEIEADCQRKIDILKGETDLAIQNVPYIDGCTKLEQKVRKIYQAMASAGSAAIYNYCSSAMLMEMQRDLEGRNKKAFDPDEDDEERSAGAAEMTFYDMWGWICERLPDKDMSYFSRIFQSVATLRTKNKGDVEVLPSDYLSIADEAAAGMGVLLEASRPAWTLYFLLRGIDGKAPGNGFVDKFYRLDYKTVSSRDVHDLKVAIKGSQTIRISSGFRSTPASASAPMEKARQAQAKAVVKGSGKETRAQPIKEPEGKVCWKCGGDDHFSFACPTKTAAIKPYRVDKRGSGGKSGKDGSGDGAVVRFSNKGGAADKPAKASVVTILDRAQANPLYLPENVYSQKKEMALQAVDAGYGLDRSETFHAYKEKIIEDVSRVIVDSGTTKNLANVSCLHELKEAAGRVQYGNQSVEDIAVEGILKLQIAYDTGGGERIFEAEVEAWGSSKIRSPLLSGRLLAKGGASILYAEGDDGPMDHIDFSKLGGPVIPLDDQSSFRVRCILPDGFERGLERMWLADCAQARQEATSRAIAELRALPTSAEPVEPERGREHRAATPAEGDAPATTSGGAGGSSSVGQGK